MMDDLEKLAIRECLARAQGWTKDSVRDYIWVRAPYSRTLPDPFTSANDLLVLLEWLLKREWIGAYTSYPYCDGGICVVIDRRSGSVGNVIASIVAPTLQEALTIAIYRALLEVEQNGK